jgi:hypothetical protein
MWRDTNRASRWAAWLNGSQYRSANGLGKLNRREVSLGVKVVVARLVDDPNLPMLRCISVRENPIDFSALQGNFVAFILKADNELFCG